MNHVTLQCNHLDRSIAFYKTLGLRLIVRNEKYARLECPEDGSTLSLDLTEGVVHPGSVSVCFEQANASALDTFVSEIKKRGLPVSNPEDRPWLWREAWLRDPDQHPICLYFAGVNRRSPPWRLQ